MIFNSVEEIKVYILSHSASAINQAKEMIYQVLDKFVKQYYAEFSPEMYERTYQLYKSLVKTDVISTGDGWEATVYFDFNSLVYTSGSSPSGRQVMDAASYGGHGAEGLKVIKGNTGIWNDSIAILDKQAYEILKKTLIQNGIPINK